MPHLFSPTQKPIFFTCLVCDQTEIERKGRFKHEEDFCVKRECHILLVEDSPTDAVLFLRAVNRINPDATVSHVADATAASVFLKQDGIYPDAPRPDIIVCDSILNSESGLDLLEWVRVHPRFREMPFVVLSGSSSPELQSRLSALGATAFFQKPADTEVFREVIRQILLHLPHGS